MYMCIYTRAHMYTCTYVYAAMQSRHIAAMQSTLQQGTLLQCRLGILLQCILAVVMLHCIGADALVQCICAVKCSPFVLSIPAVKCSPFVLSNAVHSCCPFVHHVYLHVIAFVLSLPPPPSSLALSLSGTIA